MKKFKSFYGTNFIIKETFNKFAALTGIGGRMIDPLPQGQDCEIVEFERLGGLLRSYRRVKKPLEEAA